MNYYLGEIIAFAGTYVPQNFQLCDGTLLNINGNEALYTVIGTTYGGNGTTNFAVPDLRGLVVVGTGSSYALAQKGGASEATLTTSNLPVHNHLLTANTANGTTTDPTNAFLATSVPVSGDYPNAFAYSNPPTVAPPVSGILNTASMTNSGGSQPHDNTMPYVTICYMICTSGIYPTPS